MRTLKFFTAALVMLAAVACTKNQGGPETYEAVKLKVQFNTTKTNARSTTTPVTNGYQSVVKEAHVFVLNPAGAVIADGAYVVGGTTVIETTTEAAKVLVVANYPTSFDPEDYEGTTRAAIEAAVFGLTNLQPADLLEDDGDTPPNLINEHGVRYAMLYNYDDGTTLENTGWNRPAAVGENPAEWSVTVNIAPVVTRFEIGKISGTLPLDTDDPDVSGLESYTLAGIYMNNVYVSLNLADNVSPAGTKLAAEGIADMASYAWAKDAVTGMEDALEYELADGKMWSYHVAPIKTAGNTDGVNTPWITLHLQDVVYEGGIEAEDDDMYVVVRSYTKTDVAVTEFQRGHVYKIGEIKFNKEHVTRTSNPTDVNLTVAVNVMGWVVENIEAVPGT